MKPIEFYAVTGQELAEGPQTGDLLRVVLRVIDAADDPTYGLTYHVRYEFQRVEPAEEDDLAVVLPPS